MNILQAIIDYAGNMDTPITAVMRGLHWTAVVSRRCGLASTMTYGSCNNETENIDTVPFTDMTAVEVAQRSFSQDLSEASLGLAAVNSLIDINPEDCIDIDGLKHIYTIGKGKNISVIGHFPFLEELSKIAKNLWIIEKRPQSGDVPEDEGEKYISQSDIVVISSTTLINHTLPGIIDLCKKGSLKMLLGPSTPMTRILFDFGIDMLSGSMVTDKEKALKSIAEGANFRRLKRTGAVRFVTMQKNHN